MMTQTMTLSSLEDRALKLLGSGISAEHTALTLGVTASAIAQMVSKEDFAIKLAELKYESLQKNNVRDGELDSMEDSLIKQLKSVMPMVMRPMELIRLFQIVNSAKRRGASNPEQITQKQQVVRLTLPIQIINKFQVNGQNQVIQVDDQNLVTVQSGQMSHLAKASDERKQSQSQSLFLEESLAEYGL